MYHMIRVIVTSTQPIVAQLSVLSGLVMVISTGCFAAWPVGIATLHPLRLLEPHTMLLVLGRTVYMLRLALSIIMSLRLIFHSQESHNLLVGLGKEVSARQHVLHDHDNIKQLAVLHESMVSGRWCHFSLFIHYNWLKLMKWCISLQLHMVQQSFTVFASWQKKTIESVYLHNCMYCWKAFYTNSSWWR